MPYRAGSARLSSGSGSEEKEIHKRAIHPSHHDPATLLPSSVIYIYNKMHKRHAPFRLLREVVSLLYMNK